MAPPVAAAARAALELMRREPERVRHLQAVGQRFLEKTRSVGIDTGTSTGLAIVPAITGSSMRAVRLANRLFDNGVNVQPIVYPAVGEKAARLRFFLSAEHTEEDIDKTVDCLAQAW
jgi:8-amino-7-oxononanoate synthase